MTAKASANTDNALTAAVARAQRVRFVRTKKKAAQKPEIVSPTAHAGSPSTVYEKQNKKT